MAQPAPAPERQVSFRVFSAQPIADLAYVPRPGSAPVSLAFYPTAHSPRYAYTGPASLQFIDATTGAVAAEITVPPKIVTALFILSALEPLATRTVRYRVQVVDDSAERHPPGTLLILNFSGLELSGTINRRPVTLNGGLNAPIRMEMPAAIILRTPFKNRSYQAYADTISLEKSGRALLLLLPPYRQGSLEVQSRVLLDAPVSEPRKSSTD